MNWLQHVFVALALCHAVLFVFHVPWSGPLLAAAALGAWLPDVDHEKTRLFKFSVAVLFAITFSYVYAVVALVGVEKAWAALGAGVLVSLMWAFLKPRHRGLMHHPLVGIGLGLVLFFSSGLFWAGAVGALAFESHVLADGCFF